MIRWLFTVLVIRPSVDVLLKVVAGVPNCGPLNILNLFGRLESVKTPEICAVLCAPAACAHKVKQKATISIAGINDRNFGSNREVKSF